MNKTTIKISVLAFLGFMTYGYAQQQQQDPYKGKVGVNTIEPSATMDIRPSTANAQKEATTNEGIIAPKLSKTRIANIETPVEGTLVYATDETTSPISAYTGGDTKVAKITEKGYYYYNGTEWVKAGSDVTDQLWAQRDNGGVTETYLKPAEGVGNSYYFSGKGSTLLLGNISENATWETSNTLAHKFDEIPNFIGINSSKFKRVSTMANGDYLFSKDSYQLFGADAVNGVGKNYVGKVFSTEVQSDVTANVHSVSGLNTSISHKGNSKVNYLTGLDVYTFMGTIHDSNTPEATSNIAAGFKPRILKGKVDNVTGIWTYPIIYGGEVNNITGSNMVLNTSELLNGVTSTLPTMNYKQVIGYKTDVNNKMNTTTDHLAGADFFTGYENGSTANYGYAFIGRAQVKEGAVVNNYHGVVSYLQAMGNANVGNVYGFKYSANFSDTFKPINEFGLWIDNVNKGTTINRAIHTEAGQIRFGDLQHSVSTNVASTGDRPVFVTADGVLKIGNASTALSRAVWETDGNHVKLAVKADGTDRTDNIITINDEGQMFASSFKGTNGATIFPDYVFQKYYTGTSSIKADYNFKSLSQVEDFVKANGHLPGYKSAATIKAQGYVDLMETQLTNVEKIEELYLHSIEQDKVNKQQAEALKAKDAEIADLKQRLERLEKLIQ